MAKLKDICTINPKTVTLEDDLEVSFVPMPKVGEQGEFDPSEIKTYQEVKKGFTNFQNGDVLFAKITPCMENGKGAIAKDLRNGYGFGSTEFHVLRPDYSKVTSEWLYYLTSWDEFRKEAEGNMTGSAGQKRVPKAFLENYEVQLPAVQKQKEMADIMNHIGNLIALRKEQLAKLDQLVKSRFIELFGDPVSNPMGWGQKTLKEVCLKLNDGTHFSPESFETGEYKYVTAKNIKMSGFDFSNITYVPEEVHRPIYERCNPELGDVLYIKDGATTGIAMVNTLEEEFTLLSSVALLKQDRRIMNGYFLAALLNNESMYTDIRGNMGGAAITRLTIAKLHAIKVVLPPIELQNQFATFVEQTDKSKLAIQQSLEKLETLKKALMQEYFG